MNNGADDKVPADKLYALKYHIETGEFKAGDQTELEGLTDALVMMSVLYFEDGSSSSMLMSVDGRGDGKKALPAKDVFMAWSIMASSLSKNEDLTPEIRILCSNAFEATRALILAAKKERIRE